jgi:hypothetical protein
MLTPFIGAQKLGESTREMPFDGLPTHPQNSRDLIVQEILQGAQDHTLTVVHPQPPEASHPRRRPLSRRPGASGAPGDVKISVSLFYLGIRSPNSIIN